MEAGMDDGIRVREFHEATGTEAWRVIGDGACSFFRTGSFTQSAQLVEAIAGIAGVDDHPPSIDVRADGVTVRLLTTADDWYGMTQRDVELARRITAAARDIGLSGDPSDVQSVLVIPGSIDAKSVMPFWQAALGYVRRPDSPDEDLVDPRDRGPAFWFEDMHELRGDGGGAIHVAVWVPPEQGEARMRAALEAGGRVVRDVSPSWWTLADAAGNEIDVSTALGRD
jgi:4a-hydroxytetrahydrobiopterin dehydratase